MQAAKVKKMKSGHECRIISPILLVEMPTSKKFSSSLSAKIPLFGIYPRKMKVYLHQNVYIQIGLQ